MNQINPYLKTREAVFARLGAGTQAQLGLEEQNPQISTAMQAAMAKAKSFEQDAGAAATGDVMAQVRLAGKSDSIKRDIDEDQYIQEMKFHVLKSLLKMQMTFIA